MKRVLFIVLVLAITSVCFSVTSVQAELRFDSLEGTWWIITKSADTGRAFQFPPEDSGQAKTKKFRRKRKGYLYFPPNSYNNMSYENVLGLFSDPKGKNWYLADITTVISGGRPNDFACICTDSGTDYGFLLAMRIKLKEDIRNPGQIKSGTIRTLSGVAYGEVSSDVFAAGKRDFKAKLVSINKVPDQVKNLLPNPACTPITLDSCVHQTECEFNNGNWYERFSLCTDLASADHTLVGRWKDSWDEAYITYNQDGTYDGTEFGIPFQGDWAPLSPTEAIRSWGTGNNTMTIILQNSDEYTVDGVPSLGVYSRIW